MLENKSVVGVPVVADLSIDKPDGVEAMSARVVTDAVKLANFMALLSSVRPEADESQQGARWQWRKGRLGWFRGPE